MLRTDFQSSSYNMVLFYLACKCQLRPSQASCLCIQIPIHHVCDCGSGFLHLKSILKNLRIVFFFKLFLKIKKKIYYFNIFLSKNYFKKQSLTHS